MEVVKLAEAPFYTLPDHEQIVARRLQGADASGADFAMIGHSTFPAGARVPMGAGPTPKIYVVVEGALTVEQIDGAEHVLNMGDSILIHPGEQRAIRNGGSDEAAMIVVTPPAQ